MDIEKPITLDLLETNAPALSSTNDMPVIETKPDATPNSKPADGKPAEEPTTKVETAAPDEGKTKTESAPADVLEQPESTSASDEPKPAKGVQKRLDELTKQREEANRRAEQAAEDNRRLMALLEAKEKKVEAPKSEVERPKRDDYASPDDYDVALVEYAAHTAREAAQREFEAQQAEERQQREQASIAEERKQTQTAYVARVEKFKEAHADYSAVAESPDVQISIPMAHAIVHSENGPQLAYYLGSNKAEAQRIATLPPPVQLMELGRIEAKLTTPTPKPVSAAPAPITPTKPAEKTAELSDEELSMEQYAAKRHKQWTENRRPGTRH